jgi:flavin reductase (DIM6/NTAB) family NADH-FMN oxidoreductase RutF
MKTISSEQISEMEKHYRINLINSLSGYKSLHLLGTISTDKITNLCIVSSVFHLGANPPLIGLVIRPQRPHNDSLRNLKSTSQYTLNNVLPEWYISAHQTSASFPSGISEFNECGLHELYDHGFDAPFVEESSVRIGLELQELIDMKINSTTIVIGKVLRIIANDSIIEQDGRVNHELAGTITAIGLDSYYKTSALGRVSYANPAGFTRNIE